MCRRIKLENGRFLTQAEEDFYHRNGYLVVENMFTYEECDLAVATYRKYALPDFRGIMNFDRGEIEYKKFARTFGGKDITGVIKVDDEDQAVIWKMITDERMIGMLDTLQKAEVVLLQSMFLFKEAGSDYCHQAWNLHQDTSYPNVHNHFYITANIAFTDQDPFNGGMFILPGSHKEPILEFEQVESFHEKPGSRPGRRIINVPSQYEKVDLIIKKGSVLFLDGHVIHGSYPNESLLRSRYMLLVPYGTKGITSLPGFVVGKDGNRKEIPVR